MILIYGGAFNPPTKAHYLIAEKLIEKYNPTSFYFLPVGMKYNKGELASFNDRYNMCSILANKLNCLVSDKENVDKYEGTYYTLKEFKKIDEDVRFIMGADNLSYLHNWIMAKNLVKEFKFIILERSKFDVIKYLKEHFCDYLEHFDIISFSSMVSSSKFRVKKDKALVLDDVYEYIVKNNLYEV